MANFSNAKTVIIGGSSGIGLAIAHQLVRNGGQVIIAGRTEEKIQSAVGDLGSAARGKKIDITDFETLPDFFKEIGEFDHLVITSTQTLFKPISELTSAPIFSMVNTKLLGSFFAVQAALKFMNTKGSILFFGGVVGQKAVKNGSIVGLINSGLEGLTRALALELAPIRVNLIAPGIVDTGRWNGMTSEEKQKIKAATGAPLPVQRVGEPEDLANAALMALENTFITGSIIRVDGGGQL